MFEQSAQMKSNYGGTQEDLPVVSIIVPAYNSRATIGPCLQSIRALEYPAEKIELIVIDNGSKDETRDIAAKAGATVIVRSDIFVSEMRNVAAKQARGEVFAFVDSDCVIAADWLINALRHLKNEAVGAAGCGYALGASPCWIERHWFYLHLDSGARAVTFLPAGNMAVRQSVFQKVGGFDPHLETGEDSDLCLRLRKEGFQIISDGAIRNVHLGNPKSLRKFLRKEIWYGKGLAACMNSHDWKDRTFVLTNLFLVSLFGMAAGIILSLLAGNPILLICGLSGAIMVVLVSTAYRTIQRRSLTSFFHLAVLHAVYYLGRSISLSEIYCRHIAAVFRVFGRRRSAKSEILK
ncbi:MAG: glycosyltransferase [Candidatus Abyssobacteria bacterium SURF_5]|uniref:Glycosyltransferase n=1 Tax=Abyssobacteria bacterium (strain SURF_5) TaxID=2093360 RepID=A0A3A4NY19_ABYX5|nr:MAG: glycosyltransferase [Candidatus Abyssubacteria bacterium SURF_5]